MKIAIQNNKNTNHTICRPTGQRITIHPHEYTILDTDNDNEIRYWENIDISLLNKIGLNVLLDEMDIVRLQLSSGLNNNTVDVSIVDSGVSPIAKQIADSIMPKKCSYESNAVRKPLSELSKEELFELCDKFGIKYKRNNSVKTLTRLLTESGVVEQ